MHAQHIAATRTAAVRTLAKALKAVDEALPSPLQLAEDLASEDLASGASGAQPCLIADSSTVFYQVFRLTVSKFAAISD